MIVSGVRAEMSRSGRGDSRRTWGNKKVDHESLSRQSSWENFPDPEDADHRKIDTENRAYTTATTRPTRGPVSAPAPPPPPPPPPPPLPPHTMTSLTWREKEGQTGVAKAKPRPASGRTSSSFFPSKKDNGHVNSKSENTTNRGLLSPVQSKPATPGPKPVLKPKPKGILHEVTESSSSKPGVTAKPRTNADIAKSPAPIAAPVVAALAGIVNDHRKKAQENKTKEDKTQEGKVQQGKVQKDKAQEGKAGKESREEAAQQEKDQEEEEEEDEDDDDDDENQNGFFRAPHLPPPDAPEPTNPEAPEWHFTRAADEREHYYAPPSISDLSSTGAIAVNVVAQNSISDRKRRAVLDSLRAVEEDENSGNGKPGQGAQGSGTEGGLTVPDRPWGKGQLVNGREKREKERDSEARREVEALRKKDIGVVSDKESLYQLVVNTDRRGGRR